jgi:hypothetical protein
MRISGYLKEFCENGVRKLDKGRFDIERGQQLIYNVYTFLCADPTGNLS